MKRVIVSAEQDEYKYLSLMNNDESKLRIELDGDIVYKLDPEFFDTYCYDLFAIIPKEGKRGRAYIEIHIRRGSGKKFTAEHTAPITQDVLKRMVSRLKDDVFDYLDSILEEKSRSDDLKSQGFKYLKWSKVVNHIFEHKFGMPDAINSTFTAKRGWQKGCGWVVFNIGQNVESLLNIWNTDYSDEWLFDVKNIEYDILSEFNDQERESIEDKVWKTAYTYSVWYNPKTFEIKRG